MTAGGNVLFNRKCTLQITDTTGNGLDLSNFRIVFSTEAADADHPNSAVIRVYNLDPKTVKRIKQEFTYVSLQAGYQNNPFAAIFIGTVKQFRVGKESATRTYLDLLCADADIFFNQGFMNVSFAAGHNPAMVIAQALKAGNAAIAKVANATGAVQPPVTQNPAFDQVLVGVNPAPRGKVMFGAARDIIHSTAATLNCSWSIQNGVLQVIPFDKYLPNETVVLSQFSGVVGIPEVTNEGIKIKCLLNPLLQVGATVQLDNSLINTIINASGNLGGVQGGSVGINYKSYGLLDYQASTDLDGLYRVFCIEHEGDTRGNKWYSNLTCLATSRSTNQVLTNPVTGG